MTTHERFSGVKPRSAMMCGIAMFTIVPSSTTMSWAAVMTVRAMPR